jgi:Acyl-CoA carboxylase epsilon subunit
LRIEPNPTPEEAAAIMAALEALREEEPQDRDTSSRSGWRLAGLLGHAVSPGMDLEGSLWSYSSGEGMT